MKKTLAFILLCTSSVFAQQQARLTIAEVKNPAPAPAAPRQCLLAFREFFSYLQKSEPSIVRDERAQKLYLSDNLRKALIEKVATFPNQAADPDFPGNSTFIGSWDYPSTYAVVSSRSYGKRAIVDVLYKWGPKTNYPGDERTTSFIYVFENRLWKLDDVYTFRGEFAPAESLNQYLREK